jgi:predicted O-linked N-acetylglucosamine transferase (SPINDLY family)
MLQQAMQAFQSGSFDGAELILKRVLQVDSKNLSALHILGLIKASQSRFKEATDYLAKAAKIDPNDATLQYNLAKALSDSGNNKEALSHHKKAVGLAPNNPEAWLNYGKTASDLCRYYEAIAHYDQALTLKPDYPEGWYNKGATLHELKRYDEAITHYDQALGLKPDYAEAWSNKGVTLNKLVRYDEAIAHYDQALGLKLDIDWIFGDLLHTKMKICSWTSLAESLEIISKKVMANEKVITPFPLLALNDDPLLHQQCAKIYAQDRFPLNLALGPLVKRPASQKIRIGYFSADFKNHPVSFLTAELFELHDKNKFEIIAFSFGVDDQSPMRSRLSQAFNQFFDVYEKSDKEIALLARKLEIDIAVDLGGHTQDSRTGIFSYRAAPIQLGYIGYLGTMGAEYFDYLITDETIIPAELQKFYSEKIVCLPSYQVNDRKRVISDRQFTRQELGLPENGFVFCCFNNNYKILPATFDLWMRILKRVEDSILFLYADNEWSKANLISEARVKGIDGARLVFGERISTQDYLARYRVCDLFLDTFPYNAGTTASDALWTGLPVLTLMGQSFASRVAASLLNAIGLPELITNTQEEYEALAIELATNPQKLVEIKLKLVNNRMTTPLFDTPLFTKNLEAAYIKMHERCLAGLPLECIYV